MSYLDLRLMLAIYRRAQYAVKYAPLPNVLGPAGCTNLKQEVTSQWTNCSSRWTIYEQKLYL